MTQLKILLICENVIGNLLSKKITFNQKGVPQSVAGWIVNHQSTAFKANEIADSIILDSPKARNSLKADFADHNLITTLENCEASAHCQNETKASMIHRVFKMINDF